MLINFKLDKYSSLNDIDLLLTRCSENLVTALTVTKEGDAYSFQYSFGTESIISEKLQRAAEAVYDLKISYLTNNLRDAFIHFSGTTGSLITNITRNVSVSIKQDALLEAVLSLEKAKALVTELKLQSLETSLTKKVDGSRKAKIVTVLEAIDEAKAKLSDFNF